MLSEHEINHFRTFGFLKLPGLLTADELAVYEREFNGALSRWPDNRDTSKKSNHYAVLSYESTPFAASLLDDNRFAESAQQLLGKPALGVSTNGSIWHGETDWHPDVDVLGFSGIRFAIYLDELKADSGALRFIPGSHRDSLFSSLKRDMSAEFGVSGPDVPSWTCESRPGDVIAFNLAVWHAAFHGVRRRQGAVVYFEDPDTPELRAQATERFERAIRRVTKYGQPSWFTPYWQSVPDARHQSWVQRVRELGFVP